MSQQEEQKGIAYINAQFDAQANGDSLSANVRDDIDGTSGRLVRIKQSGLVFRVLDPGQGLSGLSPTITSPCNVHYEGRLIDGQVFDSTYGDGEPCEFAPCEVIPGWTEALQYMVEGEKWEVFLKHELGYGVEGSPPDIPPRATLVFKIELVNVLGAPKSGAAAKRDLLKAMGHSEEEEKTTTTVPPASTGGANDDDSESDDIPYGADDLDMLS